MKRKGEKIQQEPPVEEITSTPNAINWMAGLMFIQFFSRMLHFVLNLVIVRFLSPENYGLSALQLPLVATAVTRLFKEAFHRVAVVSFSYFLLSSESHS